MSSASCSSLGKGSSSTRNHRRLEDARSPSPEGPRATIAATVSHTSASAPDRAACNGDIFVVDVASGDHFHITTALKGPFHPLTSVTHRALQHTVRNLLLASPNTHTGDSTTQPRPPLLLLLDGVPLGDSDALTLPNGAVVEVHRDSAASLPRPVALLPEQGMPLQSTSAVSARSARLSALEAVKSGPAEEENLWRVQSTAPATTVPFPSRRLPPRGAGGASSNIGLPSDGDNVAGTRDSASPYALMRTSGTAASSESRPRGAVTLVSTFHASAHEDCVVSRQLILSSSLPSRHGGASVSTRSSEEETTSASRQVPSLHTVNDTQPLLHQRTSTYSSIGGRPRAHQSDAAVRGATASAAGPHTPSSASSTLTPLPSTAFTSPAFSQDSPAATEESLTHRRHALPSSSRASAADDRPSSTPLRPSRAAPSVEPSPTSSASALVSVALQNAAASDRGSEAVPASALSAPPAEHSQLQTSAPLPSSPPLQLTAQEIYDTQRSSIAAAAAAEQRRLLTRLQQRCQVLEEEKKALLPARLGALRAQESAGRLRALREAQEEAAAVEVDAVRARLGQHREDLLSHWLRVLQHHKDTQYAMPSALLRQLEAEGEALTLHCLSSIAGYHTQKARLQALQWQRVLKEAEVARLRWEAQVRQCTVEEQRGCLRVVARLRPPSERSWLPASVLASAEAGELDGGYAVRVLEGPPDAARGPQQIIEPVPCVVEVTDPPRDLRRRYALWAAYNAANAGSQQRLFEDQLQPLLEHMCRTGQNVAVLAFGAVGSGKTCALFGSRAAQVPRQPVKTAHKGVLPPQPHRVGGESASAEVFSDFDFSGSRSSRSHSEGDEVGRMPNGVTTVGAPGRRGITRCLDPADAAREAQVLESLAETEAAKRRQRSAERHAREERGWRERAGIEEGDGLLPRAVAWLTAHLRSESPHGKASGPVVESIVFSMYEVYNDHVYDLLPTPPPSAAGTTEPDSKASWAAWPRWNAGWLPAPHIKNSNPENLTELQLELLPPSTDGRGAVRDASATVSHLLPPQPAQPQWRVKASEMEVRTATEALQAIHLGLDRRRSAATLRGAQSSRSHLFLHFRVKVQRPIMPAKSSSVATQWASATAAASALEVAGIGALIGNAAASADATGAAGKPKGYDFLRAALATPSEGATSAKPAAPASSLACVAELLFTDFAGSERIELSGVTGDALKEVQYIHSSLSAVSAVLTALARAHPRREHQGEAEAAARRPGKQRGGGGAPPLAAAALVQRWGAMAHCPGVTLSRSPPVFLQPRFTKLGGDRDTRQRGGHEGSLALRRRVLPLMDKHVAEEEGVQWWRRWRAAPPHVPFRTCKTTQLLQSALGAPCKLLVLACVQPCSVSEVVLPASLHDRKGPRTRAAAQSVFAHQAPVMLSEVHATLAFAERIHEASQDGGKAKRAQWRTRGDGVCE
ncbi:putative kinesin [Leishmania major strain Friedlin]|uniref:Putative kinesin n=1 Tax=Leishmania major TaxID=5664 RepID=Q4QG84_LEIMA|nr:putative kinesin [Leishmania major strain Friedlin]CAG9570993.1 kinesin_-_putative [Leishmania major strain Friedlin]CAJ02677.1 putative kinesin [Leishmania major strain Friedlin]|eukprot:XP_001681814.1 putative kinesin [Leishmania major strain Friedlin]